MISGKRDPSSSSAGDHHRKCLILQRAVPTIDHQENSKVPCGSML
jgi:hypothetical protein